MSEHQPAEESLGDLEREIESLTAESHFAEARPRVEKGLQLLAEAQSSEAAPGEDDAAHRRKVWLHQKLAICTYKDPYLPAHRRFADALEVLEKINLRVPEKCDAETLGLGGAIQKRMWEQNGRLDALSDARYFYQEAWTRFREDDQGYGGINAAFTMQVLAARARAAYRRSGSEVVSEEEQGYLAEARKLREEVRDFLLPALQEQKSKSELQPEDYWRVATLAEAHYGLEEYSEAEEWLAEGSRLKPADWHEETTFRQLVAIAKYQGHEVPQDEETEDWGPPWKALKKLFGDRTASAISCHRGKVGLALSGGGFRASFFHLGVLARLAEMGVLPSIEVLSTVSGGSIVGAQYYLELQRLLQKTEDRALKRGHFECLVRKVQRDFLKGVRENIRTRVVANLWQNVRMVFSTKYSRTHRLGELYEKYLYSKVKDEEGNPVLSRKMTDLFVKPEGEPDGFRPREDNWRRRARVPILLLNTTCLNTGHNWKFTAAWMGEPPGLTGSEVDKTPRYRRLWYEDARTPELREVPLGHAVAASSCVPALFEPLEIKGGEPSRTVRLVDGGVHDNQGVCGLLDEGCNFILCSDASGQMDEEPEPPNGLLGVPLRSNDILMARVRASEYQDLKGRLDSHSIRGLFFVHLKQDLPVHPISWEKSASEQADSEETESYTNYEVDHTLLQRLAAIRTDLDSFSEVEAYSLMCAGYLMTEHQFKKLQEEHVREGQPGNWGGYDVHQPRGDWEFLKLAPVLKERPGQQNTQCNELDSHLETGSQRAFKVWSLHPVLKAIRRRLAYLGWGALAVLAIAGVCFWNHDLGFETSIKVGHLLIAIAAICGFSVPMLSWLIAPRKAARRCILKAVVAVLGFLGANIHLLFDRLFIEQGKLERLLREK